MLLYATSGGHFVYGSRITWSFMPDGTNIWGTPSNLISTFDSKFGVGRWQSAFQSAAAKWENQANINLVQVGDDGASVNSGNYQQGSPEFGDIRIGGYAMDRGSLALTLSPPPNNGGSDSGDMFFNTDQLWQLGFNWDVETVAFHELGHALGLGHSTDAQAAMFSYYTDVKQMPNADDVAGIQAVWGPRQEDGLARTFGNLTASRAVDIMPLMNNLNQIILPTQNIASSSESYWFKVTTPASASNYLSVAIQTVYLSELSPRVQIYDANMKGLVQTAAPADSYGTVIGTTYTQATPNSVYYIRVMPSTSGPTGTGAYAMLLNMGTSAMGLVPPPYTQVQTQPDRGGGGSWELFGGGKVDMNGQIINNGDDDVPEVIQFPQGTALGDYLLISPQFASQSNLPVLSPHPSIPPVAALIPNPAGSPPTSTVAADPIGIPKKLPKDITFKPLGFVPTMPAAIIGMARPGVRIVTGSPAGDDSSK